MPRKHALTFHAIARSRRHDYHLAGDCSRVRSQSAAQRSREQHERARVITAFERIVGEYEVFPEAERGVAAAVHERDRALGYDLHAIDLYHEKGDGKTNAPDRGRLRSGASEFHVE